MKFISHSLVQLYNNLFVFSDLNSNVNKLMKKFPNFSRQQIEEIARSVDPTPENKKTYLPWIVSLMSSGNIRFPEDTEKVNQALKTFDKLKSKPQFNGSKNIYSYKTYGDLVRIIDESSGVKTKGEEYRGNLTTGMQEIYGDSVYRVIKLTTPEATSKLCRGTEWCVKDPKFSKDYLEKGPLFLFYKNGERYALLHFDSKQFKDIYDKELKKEQKKELEHIALNINSVLWKLNFNSSLVFNKDDINFIVKSASYSCYYAKDVLKGPFPAGEPAIAKDAMLSYDYARDVLKGPFAAGEPAILNSAYRNDYIDLLKEKKITIENQDDVKEHNKIETTSYANIKVFSQKINTLRTEGFDDILELRQNIYKDDNQEMFSDSNEQLKFIQNMENFIDHGLSSEILMDDKKIGYSLISYFDNIYKLHPSQFEIIKNSNIVINEFINSINNNEVAVLFDFAILKEYRNLFLFHDFIMHIFNQLKENNIKYLISSFRDKTTNKILKLLEKEGMGSEMAEILIKQKDPFINSGNEDFYFTVLKLK